MSKALVFAALAFLVSAAATTGVMVKMHPPAVDSTAARPAPAAHPDSTASPDSAVAVAADSERADSAAGPAAPPGQGSAGAAAGPAGSPAATPARQPAAPGPDPVAKAAAYKQVARVLAAMKPPQAAKVLSQLSDEEVEGILRAVGPRQAADFLTNLSTERAGVLSRRLLVPQEKGPGR